MYQRAVIKECIKRISESRKFIQVLAGPRQTGKTTIARQLIDIIKIPSHYAAADEPLLKNTSWIEQQWETARAKISAQDKKVLLILDEIQRIPLWSDIVKCLWDEDSASHKNLSIILLGSSPLLVQKGLTESLAGRFEIIPVTHWSYEEMHTAFGWNVDEYIFFGGYPGSVPLIKDQHRWSDYIKNFLIETTVSKDILLMTRVDKPALLRRLFELGCSYSGRVLSYQKMIGQLQDAGNTTTLAHYLDLLNGAGLLTGLNKYAGHIIRQRSSSPKFQVLNTALLSAQMDMTFKQALNDRQQWGHFVESAVGAYCANATKGKHISLHYWSNKNREVDFVLSKNDTIVAIEIKSGRKKNSLPGVEAFSKDFKVKRKLLVGEHGIPIKDFLSHSPEEWF